MDLPNAWAVIVGFGVLSMLLPCGTTAHGQTNDTKTPVIFQTAGPTAASIQSTVDAFRAVAGFETPNGNNPGPLASGRREINWDGGDPTFLATTSPVTPFNTFLNGRGSQFTTPGSGLSQAPPSGGPQGGLAGLFGNATYGQIFTAFSPSRLFTPVGSNITDALFFIPGSNGTVPAAVRGFGAVFTDVDRQDNSGSGGKRGKHKGANTSKAGTLIEYFDLDGKLLFSGSVPASPGDGSLSFFGIVFDDARIARVRITTGNAAPGLNDDSRNDIVMMDDFIYGEPQVLTR